MHVEPSAGGKHSSGFPAYVRGWCCKARERTLQRGFRDVGYLFAARLGRFRPREFDRRSWRQCLGRLHGTLSRGDDRAAVEWFEEVYPGLMAVIPVEERPQFVAGLRERRRG